MAIRKINFGHKREIFLLLFSYNNEKQRKAGSKNAKNK